MGKRRGLGPRFRLPCSVCQRLLDVSPVAKQYVGYHLPGGDVIMLVCDADCEKRLYQDARILNFFIHGEAVAMDSDAVLRFDLLNEHGGVSIRDGKLVYLDIPDKPTPKS